MNSYQAYIGAAKEHFALLSFIESVGQCMESILWTPVNVCGTC